MGARACISGVNVDLRGRKYPRVSRDHFQVLENAVGTFNDSVLEIVLRRICQPGSDAWKNFMAVRKGKRVPMEDGKGDYIVERSAVPRYVPPWEKAKFGKQSVVHGKKVKMYSLTQVLMDSYIRTKYDIPQKLIVSAGQLALTSPADAAATLQEFIQFRSKGSDVDIRVSAGAYASGSAGAVRDIRMMAKKAPALQAGTPCRVIGERFFAFADDTSETIWHVRGPLNRADTVMDVFRLAMTVGRHEAIHMFAQETAILGIDIFIGNDVVSPSIINHSAAPDDYRYLNDSGVEEMLSPLAAQRFELLKVNVLSLDDGAVHRASSLRLSENVVLSTQHVYAELVNPVVQGVTLGVKQVIGGDLWAFKHGGFYSRWSFREPVIGELACVMFHNGEKVALSASFKVASCDGSLIISEHSDGVYPGMSGGAVVALSDMALLGVHRGAMLTKLRATRVTEATYFDVCDFVTESNAESDVPLDNVAKISQLLVSRSLASVFQELVSSVTAVYDSGRRVGSALSVDGSLVTAVAPGFYEVDKVSGLVEFVDRGGGLLTVSRSGCVVPSVSRCRSPQAGESVVLLGLDGSQLLLSDELRVSHVGPYARNFVVTPADGLEAGMVGSVAVSLYDGCVLGIMVKEVSQGVFCMGVNAGGDEVRPSAAEEVARVFPKFTVSAWDQGLLSKAFDVAEAVDLADLGKAELRVRFKRKLLGLAVPHAQWSSRLASVASEAALAKCVDDIGLVSSMVVHNENGVASVADRATVMAALVAVVVMHETTEEVDNWLDALGLWVDRPSMVRRSSGFDVLAVDGRVLPAFGE